MSVLITNPSLYHQVVTVTKSGNTNFTIPWNATDNDTLFFIKKLDAAGTLNWYQIDGLRGYNIYLSSDSTNAEVTDANVLSVSGTTGTLGSTLSNGSYVVQMWKAGPSASRQTNTSGTITSTVSVNSTSKFSIITYTGTGVNGATVGHGLGVAPGMVIFKQRNDVLGNWGVYHSVPGATKASTFNQVNDFFLSPTHFNNTTPTLSVIYLGTVNDVNTAPRVIPTPKSYTYVAYCFAEVAGYSKISSYTSNNSADGPFVYSGFKPRFAILKNANVAAAGYSWYVFDTSRSPYNYVQAEISTNSSAAQTLYGSADLDIVSNGIKIRRAAGVFNNSSNTIVYIMFAESCFGASNVSPTTAR